MFIMILVYTNQLVYDFFTAKVLKDQIFWAKSTQDDYTVTEWIQHEMTLIPTNMQRNIVNNCTFRLEEFVHLNGGHLIVLFVLFQNEIEHSNLWIIIRG